MTINRNMISEEFHSRLMKKNKKQIIEDMNKILVELEVALDAIGDLRSDTRNIESNLENVQLENRRLKAQIQVAQNTTSGYIAALTPSLLDPLPSRADFKPSIELKMIDQINRLLNQQT